MKNKFKGNDCNSDYESRKVGKNSNCRKKKTEKFPQTSNGHGGIKVKFLNRKIMIAAVAGVFTLTAASGALGIFSNNKKSALAYSSSGDYATSYTTKELFNLGAYDQYALMQIAWAGGYDSVAEMVIAARDGSATAAQFIGNEVNGTVLTNGITITLGGLKWIPVYLTHTRDGEAVLDLWLADDLDTTGTQWNLYRDGTTDDKYPSTLYSTSYIRSYLNGTDYAASKDATTLSSVARNDTLENFVKLFDIDENIPDSVFVTPSEIEYQEHESNADYDVAVKYTRDDVVYDNPNNSYGNEGTYLDGFDYTSYSYYGDWKNDYFWLPSVTEVGYYSSVSTEDNQYAGIWDVSAAQCNHSSTSNTWLRSGNYGASSNAAIIISTNTYVSNPVDYALSVRPAFHFNLDYAVANSYEEVYVDEPELEEDSVSYTGEDCTVGIDYLYKTEVNVECSEGLTYSYDDSTLTAKEPGVYTVTFTLKKPDEYHWRTGGTGPITRTFVIKGESWASDELYDETSGTFSASVLSQIVTAGGYNSMTEMIAAATSGDVQASQFMTGGDGIPVYKGITVTLGGYEWIPVYMTKSTDGTAVLDLWLADNLDDTAVQWNENSEEEDDNDYPLNMYSYSSIREYINSMNILSAIDKEKYIVKSSEIAYQENESVVNYISKLTYNLPNDAYGDVGGYKDGYDYSTNGEIYRAWADDYLWLPSLTETGYYSDSDAMSDEYLDEGFYMNPSTLHSGQWGLNEYQIMHDATGYTWLRSAYGSYNDNNAYALCATGSYVTTSVTSTCGIRPAIHLNLEAAAISAGLIEKVETPEISSTSASYSSAGGEFTISGLNSNSVNVILSSGLTISGNSLTAAKAGEYSVTFSLKDNFIWSDGTVDDKTIKLTVGEAEITAEWDKTNALPVIKCDLPAGAITYKYYKDGTEVAEADLTDGDYKAVATLSDTYADNYNFADTKGNTTETTFTYAKPAEPATDDNSGYTTDNNTNNSTDNNNTTDNSNDTVAPAAKSGCGSTTTNTGDGMMVGMSIALVGAALLVLTKKKRTK